MSKEILIIKHIEIEGPGTLGDFFRKTGLDIKNIELEKGEILPSAGEFEAIISMGGPMSVYDTDKYPFLTQEESFLKDAVAKDIPVLGICLGAQLLAKSRGARVNKAKQKEIGWYKLKLTKEGLSDDLFSGLNSLDVFQWHEDTFDIPKSGALLAQGEVCNNQAFRIGSCAWGLQFHPEITREMLVSWCDYYNENTNKDRIISGYYKNLNNYKKQAEVIYKNFLSVIVKRKPIAVN